MRYLAVRNRDCIQDYSYHQRNPGSLRDFLEGSAPEQRIKEAEKYHKNQRIGPMHAFPVENRDTDQNCGRKHDCRYTETVCIGEVCQVGKDGNNDDCQDHETPVDRRNVDLALVRVRRAKHTEGWERFHVDDLLKQTENSRNHGL